MKKFYLLSALLISTLMSAQYYYVPSTGYGNPGPLNTDAEFPLGGGLDASWTGIQGPSGTPVWSATQTLPFSFNFNGAAVTQYKVSTTGVLTFDVAAATVPTDANANLPSANIPNQSVVVWGINGSGTNDNIVTKTFGTAGSRQHWVFFSSYSVTGQTGWNYWSIVLEEGSDNIYIVDQRNNMTANGLTLGIQVDASTAYEVAGSPNINCNNTQSLSDQSDNTYFEFIQGTQPDYDMAGGDVNIDNFLILNNGPFSIEAEFTNLGTQTITSADMNYSINGGTPVTMAVSGFSAAPYASVTLTHPTAWAPTATGTYTVDVWLSNLNGNADGNTGNDMAMATTNVMDNFAVRKPLYETFTSSTCGPCTPANATMEGLFADAQNQGKYVSLKYQMSWPGTGDPYYTAEAGNRRNYYGINSVPRVEIDGGWDGNGNSLTQTIMDDAAAVPSFVDISGDYGVVGQDVTINVDINPLEDISSSDLRLYVAISERETFNNVKTNGETEFHNVMKKMVPDDGGTPLASLVKNQPVNQSFSYTFNGSYRLSNNASDPIDHATEHSVEEFWDLLVVVWIQDFSTKEVLQANYLTKTVSLEESGYINGVKVFPNPASDQLSVSMDLYRDADDVSMSVVNTLGQQVIFEDFGTVAEGNFEHRFDVSSLQPGMYILKVQSGDKSLIKRFIVQ
ncbi:MAG: hypothetical protein SchgKO_24970 [Schleiferiaceae bacterium]